MSEANPTTAQATNAEYTQQWAEYYKQQAANAGTLGGVKGPENNGEVKAPENGTPDTTAKKEPTEDEVLWQRVQEHPEEFDTWVKLVKKVESSDDLPKVRRSLSSLLSEYPLCFGYWKRLSSHEKRHGNTEEAMKILEAGVAATPRSHQLWTYYCQETRSAATDADSTRSLYERGVEAVGHDWSSHHFWNQYIEFETEQAKVGEGGPNFERVLFTYLKILSYPTQMLDEYFEKFQTLAMSRPGAELESALNKVKNLGEKEDVTTESIIPDRSELLKEAIALYSKTKELRDEVKQYEDAVKRPYFHVKQLETKELDNWKAYLKWATTPKSPVERTEGSVLAKEGEHWTMPLSFERVVNLFERCLVACANYPEMWRLYITFLEDYDIEKAREVYTHATSVFLKRKVDMFLEFANFEEKHSNIDGARALLKKVLQINSNSLEVVIGFANFERRQSRGDSSGVCSVYDEALTTFVNAGNEGVACMTFVSMHYARFLARHGDVSRARGVYSKAIEVVGGSTAEPSQSSAVLVLAVASLEAAQPGDVQEAVCAVYEGAVGANPKLKLPDSCKVAVWEHYITYLEDHGRNVTDVATLKTRYLAFQQSKPSRKRKAPTAAEEANKSARTAPPAQPAYYGTPQYGQYGAQYGEAAQFDPNAAAAAAAYQQQQAQWYGQQQF